MNRSLPGRTLPGREAAVVAASSPWWAEWDIDAPSGLASTFMDALATRASTEGAIRDALPGGVHEGLAPPDVYDATIDRRVPLPDPYASLTLASFAARDLNSGTSYVRAPMVLVRFFGDDPDALESATLAWQSTFNTAMIPLQWRNGYSCVLYCADESTSPIEAVGSDAQKFRVRVVRMQGLTAHTLPG